MFEKFLREKRYLQNVSNNTITWYEHSFAAYKKINGEEINKENLKEFVIRLKERGMKSGGINNYVRGVNVYLTWLFENGHTPEHLKIKKVKEEKIVVETFSDAQLQAFLSWKPKDFYGHRMQTLIALLIDTGIRIDEAFTLTRQNVDFDNLLIRVKGKGNKERVVPISLECRKRLFRFLKKHEFSYVFPTRNGDSLPYRSQLRTLKTLGERLGVTGLQVSFHIFRHTFAVNYIRSGGNVLYLQRVLGHTDLAMTRRYVDLQTEDLSLMHQRVSLLSRLKN